MKLHLVVLSASIVAFVRSVSVTSIDGLTTVTINSNGDASSISSPGHAPLALDADSGSFIGFSATDYKVSVFPNVVIAPCNSADAGQQFSFLPSGRIVTADNSHCLDVWNCGTANGTVVDLYPCDSSPTCGDPTRTLNELFALNNQTGELASLLGPLYSLCVNVYGVGGPTVNLWECTGENNQQWTYNESTRLFSSVGNPGMCLAAPQAPPPPPPPPPPCIWLNETLISGGAGTPVIVSRNASCLNGSATVTVTDTYASANTSITWTTSFEVVDAEGAALPAFTVPLGASLRPTAGAAELNLWTTWTRGCVNNGPGMCFGVGPWMEPFTPISLPAIPAQLFRLGNRDYGSVFTQFGDSITDSITVPLVSIQRVEDDFGVTLLLSPADPLVELLLRSSGNRIDFARMFRKLSPASPFNTTQHIRAHAADWRPALQLLLDLHPYHVLPHAVNTSDFDGLGGYSWEAPVNKTYAESVGFKTNWCGARKKV